MLRGHRLKRYAVASVFVALSTLTPAALVAQPLDPAVEALIQQGLRLRRHGHDDQAFTAFEAAWNASHSPRARAQMGLAAQALGRWPDADRFLREALSATSDAWITERRGVLSTSLSEIDAHLGLLEVRCNVDGAEIRVDGTARGTTPLREPLRLPAGTVAVQISAPGHLEATRQAVLTAGSTTREQIDLVAIPRPVATPPVNTPPINTPPINTPPVNTPPVNTPPVVPPVREPPTDRASLRRTLAWTAGGVAVAGIVMGGVFLGLRNAAASDFNARNEDGDPSNDCAAGSTAAACSEAESTISTRASLATVGFVVGGAAAVASTVLFLTLPSRHEAARSGLRGCSAGALSHGVGAQCEFRF